MAKIVALTGGIGSGKTTVGARFAALGVPLIDADQISRELSAPGGAAMPSITREFGAHVIAPDGGLNRAAMRTEIFSDDDDFMKIIAPIQKRSKLQLPKNRRLVA